MGRGSGGPSTQPVGTTDDPERLRARIAQLEKQLSTQRARAAGGSSSGRIGSVLAMVFAAIAALLSWPAFVTIRRWWRWWTS